MGKRKKQALTQIIAHRGASGHAPENTMHAFRLALALGADAIELDVHRCASGELVVIHDDTLERTTNGYGAVRAASLSALKKLDAGGGETIPTLAQVVEEIPAFITVLEENRRIPIFIELKHDGMAPDIADFVHHYIAKGWTYEALIIITDLHRELAELRKLDPRIVIGAGMEHGGVNELKSLCKSLSPQAILPHYALVDEDFTHACRNLRIKLFPWTVNAPEGIARMHALGVDGIITDYPDRATSITSAPLRPIP